MFSNERKGGPIRSLVVSYSVFIVLIKVQYIFVSVCFLVFGLLFCKLLTLIVAITRSVPQ